MVGRVGPWVASVGRHWLSLDRGCVLMPTQQLTAKTDAADTATDQSADSVLFLPSSLLPWSALCGIDAAPPDGMAAGRAAISV